MAKRYPVQIGNFEINEDSYNSHELLSIIKHELLDSIVNMNRPGVLLSGGVDSALLVAMIKQSLPNIPCYTVGGSTKHLDVLAAERLAKEWDLNLTVYIPNFEEISANRSAESSLAGHGIFLLLKKAAESVTDIIAGDGIDEQMGGYWQHWNKCSKFSTIEAAFNHFWEQVETNHLYPLFESVKRAGLNVYWIYLFPKVVKYISRIPLNERVVIGKLGKSFLRETARLAGVPEWVIERPKKGFCDSLSLV